MLRKPPTRTPFSIFVSVADWFGKPQPQPRSRRQGKTSRRQFGYESLEGRIVLSGVPGGVIDGTVSNASTALGQPGVTVDLTPSGGPTTSTTTNASGFYSFTGLAAGTYSVQELPPAGFTAPVSNPATVVISAAAATNGVVAGNIDSFATPETVTASTAGPASQAISVPAAEALGGNRDLIAQIVSGPGSISLTSNSFGADVLEFDSSATGTGDRTVTWDGPNSATPSVLNPTGLDHADLTVGGTATGISLTLGGDHAGGSITLNVFKDAGDWSTATASIPDTGGQATQTVFIPFSSFTTGAGTGAGNFTDVGAVQMQIIGGVEAANGQISLVQEVGPTPFITNFANIAQADLQITKVDNVGGSSITAAHGTAVPGNQIIYTIVVTNAGPGAVTGASVADPFPAVLTSVTYTATATGGATGFTASGSGNISDAAVNMPVDSTITYTVHATVNPSATGTLTNVATVTDPAGTTDPTPANNTATDIDNLSPTVDLSITKVDNVGGSSITAAQGTAVPGGALNYTIVVTNAGPSAVTGATVDDTFPANLTGVTYTATATGGATGFTASGSGNIDDTAVNMPVGSTITYSVHSTVLSSATGTLTNIAGVIAPEGTTDPTPANNSATDIDNVTPTADLSITKVDNVGGSSITAAHGTAVPGNALTYTIVVTNSGPSAVTGATVADPFPANLTGVTYTAAATAGATGFTASGSGNISDTAVNMPVGSTITYTVHATVNPTATGTLTNVATVTDPAGTVDPTPANNTATDIDNLTPTADLSITKVDNVGGSSITAAHGTAVPGNALTYTIVVTNSGPSAVTGASVADPFPANLTGVTYTGAATGGATGFTASGSGNISDTAVNMPVGSTITYTVHATVSPTATGTLTNVATVTDPDGTVDPTPANNTATDIDNLTPTADLSITKVDNVGGSSITAAQGNVSPGGALIYTIVVTNSGPSAVTGASVTDPLPANLTAVTYTAAATGGATGFTASGSGNISDAAVNMPVGSTITYTVHATVSTSATGTLTNVGTVTDPAGTTDPTPANNTATDVDVVAASADLQITKVDNMGGSSITPSTGFAYKGGAITYTIVVTNAGPSAVTGATVADTLPTSLTGVTYTAAATGGATGFTASGSGNIDDTAVSLPAGSKVTYTVHATVASTATGTLTNTATVTPPGNVPDPTPSNNTATDTDTVATRLSKAYFLGR